MSGTRAPLSFQDMILTLHSFWSKHGCLILQPYDMRMGAGTFHTATTLRAVHSASRNDWGAICWADGVFHEAPNRKDLEILDRVGGGDSFASGLIYGFLKYNHAQKAVDYGAAHGALAMTTPGDTSMASLKEVEALVRGGSARVQR